MTKNKNEEINSRIEEYKLKQCQMFTNRGFMVIVLDDNGKVIFSPYMVSNFSVDKKKIFITLYDLIQYKNIEEELDKLSKGFLCFKQKLNVVLIRLDSLNNEVYSVNYKNCKLNKYHGKNFTYKCSEPHQWYLELSFNRKEITKNDEFDFVGIESRVHNIPSQNELNFEDEKRHKRIVKKEAAILKYSNKMLEDAAEKVRNTNKLTDEQKNNKLREINKAKKENENDAMKFLNVNLNEIENKLSNEISELENNINK